MKRNFLWISFLPLTILVSSCNQSDFTSVREFGKLSEQVTKLSEEVGEDIYVSCIRRSEYTGDRLIAAQFRLAPPSSLTSRINSLNAFKEALGQKQELLEDCEQFNRPTAENFKGANQVVTNYITGLTQLATDSNFPFDTSLDNLGGAIKGLNQLNNQDNRIKVRVDRPTVDAGISIVKVIVNFLTKQYRSERLRQAIVCSNEDFHIYITGNSPAILETQQPIPSTENSDEASRGLMAAIQEGYLSNLGILGLEKAQIKEFYKAYADLLIDPVITDNNRQIEINQIITKSDEAIKIIQEKSQKTQVYLAILQSTAEAHNLLNKEFGRTEINPKTSSLCKGILDVKSASKDNSELISKELTPAEIKKAKKILVQYQVKVKSLLEKVEMNP